MTFNLQSVRKDFPIIDSGVIYLDSAASSLTPEPVLQKMLEYYREYRANIERGVYAFSQRATEEFEDAHKKIADLIHAKSEEEIVIVRNTTEGTNLVANGLQWKKGDKIVTTMLEHHSNFLVWLRIRQKYGVEVNFIKPDKNGMLDIHEAEKLIDDRTRLVAITHASNVLGVIPPVREICKIASNHGALTLVDGAQAVPHIPTDVEKLGCDFLAFSGHKMCGPTGAGCLYVKSETQDNLDPFLLGGGPVVEADEEHFVLEKGSKRFQVGTPAIAETIGLGAAADYISKIGLEMIRHHEWKFTEKIYERLSQIKNVEVYGPEPKFKVGITSFNIGQLNPHDVALALDTSANIAVRSGHHCAQPLIKRILGCQQGTVRASTYLYNTMDDIEKFVAMVAEISSALT